MVDVLGKRLVTSTYNLFSNICSSLEVLEAQKKFVMRVPIALGEGNQKL